MGRNLIRPKEDDRNSQPYGYIVTTDISLLSYVAQIVSAHVAKTEVAPEELPQLIRAVRATLEEIASGVQPEPAAPPKPAVPIHKSVFPDYIICLEDGRQVKSLKRHLLSNHGMSLEDYRQKWRLPPGYPTVAPNFSATRSRLAREGGLGSKRKKTVRA